MSLTFYPTVSRGELGKYATMTRVLLPASSWASDEVRKYGHVRGKLPVPRLLPHVVDRAADCGGFVATFKWKDYRYSTEQYVEWLDGWQPTWAATQDYCCEDEITAGQPGIVQERQDKTTAMAWHFWTTYRDVSWTWVPTIQGWHVEDYRRHASELRPLIQRMYAHYGTASAFRVGIGTLCRRASVAMIHEVVGVVSQELPGVPLHLWGIKLGTLQAPLALPEQVVSMDSAAWNGMFRTGREKWKQSGLPQRRYIFDVALPQYEAKIEKALSEPKQQQIFWSEEQAS